jgi:hypothetical protein
LGYNNIAKILHEQGLASTGQSDMFTYRNGEEWAQLGMKAKERQEAKRRMSDFFTCYEDCIPARWIIRA